MQRMLSRTWTKSLVECNVVCVGFMEYLITANINSLNTQYVRSKQLTGDFDEQIHAQAPDYPAGFALYISLGLTIMRSLRLKRYRLLRSSRVSAQHFSQPRDHWRQSAKSEWASNYGPLMLSIIAVAISIASAYLTHKDARDSVLAAELSAKEAQRANAISLGISKERPRLSLRYVDANPFVLQRLRDAANHTAIVRVTNTGATDISEVSFTAFGLGGKTIMHTLGGKISAVATFDRALRPNDIATIDVSPLLRKYIAAFESAQSDMPNSFIGVNTVFIEVTSRAAPDAPPVQQTSHLIVEFRASFAVVRSAAFKIAINKSGKLPNMVGDLKSYEPD